MPNQPEIPTLPDTLTQMKSFAGDLQQPIADLPKAKDRLQQIFDNPAVFPDVIFTQKGLRVLNLMDKKDLIEGLKIDDPKSQKKVRELLQSAILRIEDELEIENSAKTQIGNSLEYARSKISSETQQNLDQKIDAAFANDPQILFTENIIETLAENPRYQVLGNYLTKTFELSRSLMDLVNDSNRRDEALEKTKELLVVATPKGKDGFTSGKIMALSDDISPEVRQRLEVIRAKLVRHPESRDADWPKFVALIHAVTSQVLNPETAINLLLKGEQEGWFENANKINHAKEQEVIQLQNITPEVMKLFRLGTINESLQDTTNLPPQELDYLQKKTLVKAVENGIIPATWAKITLETGDLYTEIAPQEIFKSMFSAIDYLPENLKNKSGDLVMLGKYKLMRGIIVSGYIYQLLLNLPSQDMRPQIAAELVKTTAQVSQIAQEALDFTEQATGINMPDVYEQTKPLPKVDEFPLDSEKGEANKSDAKEQILPPNSQNGDSVEPFVPPAIDKKNMQWAGQDVASGGDIRGGISAEGFLQQGSRIEWQMTQRPESAQISTDYLITSIKPYYYEGDAQFIGNSYPWDSQFDWQSNTSVKDSQLQFFAKRSIFYNYEVVSVPSIWGFHITSAFAVVVDQKTNQVIKEIPLDFATSKIYDQLIKAHIKDDIKAEANQEIQIRIGLDPDTGREFNNRFIYYDQDKKFDPQTIFPEEVLTLIDSLNESNKSDAEKLNSLRNWFKNNFTYTFDKKYYNYYALGEPDAQTFYRRLFGTGNPASDLFYDPSLKLNGYCDSVNNAFALAARELDLLDGQIMIAHGYLNTGFFQGSQISITADKRHAWAVYVDNDGNLTNFDATPTKIDAFSQEVMDRNQQKPEISNKDLQQTGTKPEVAYEEVRSEGMHFPKITSQESITIDLTTPPAEKIINSNKNKPLGIGEWQLIPNPEDFVKFSDLPFVSESVHTGIDVTTYDLNSPQLEPEVRPNDYYINYNKLNFADSFPYVKDNQEFLRDFLATNKSKTLEDVSPEIRGIIELNGINVVRLPSIGEISPRSIRANILTTDSQGNIVSKKPIPLGELDEIYGGTNVNTYRLSFDIDAKTANHILVEISYKTLDFNSTQENDEPSFNSDFIMEQKFQEIVDISYFDKDTQNFLTELDNVRTVSDLEKSGIDPNIWKDVKAAAIERQAETDYQNYKLQDRDKIYLIREYLAKNFTITWDPDWNMVYSGSEKDLRQYLKRSMEFKHLSPETAKLMVVMATRTIDSNQGEFKIPIAIESGYFTDPVRETLDRYTGEEKAVMNLNQTTRSFRPIVFIKESEYIDGDTGKKHPAGYYSRPIGLIYHFEKDGDLIWKEVSPVPLDPYSTDFAARTLRKLIENGDVSPNSTTQFVMANELPEGKSKYLGIAEWGETSWYNWWLNDKNKPLEVIAGLLTSLYAVKELHRRTNWWKKLKAKDIKNALSIAHNKLGIDSSEEMFRDIEAFEQQVLAKRSNGSLVGWLVNAWKTEGFVQTQNVEKLGIWEKILDKSNIGEQSSQIGKKIIEDAAINGARTGYSYQAQQLARVILHYVYEEPWVKQVLEDKIQNASNKASLALKPIYSRVIQMDSYNSIKYWLTNQNAVHQTVIANYKTDPEKFINRMTDGFLDKIFNDIKSINIKIIKSQNNKNVRLSKSRPVTIDEIKAQFTAEEIQKIREIGRALVIEVKIPYILLLSQEKMELEEIKRAKKQKKHKNLPKSKKN